jgi:hypothetical protein
MKLKCLLLFVFFSFSSFSQISVGSSHIGKSQDLKPKDYEQIKLRKTLFVIQGYTDREFHEMISDVWDLNSFEVITKEEYDSKADQYNWGNYAIFDVYGQVTTRTTQNGGAVQYLYINYRYFYYDEIKKNKKGETVGKYNQLACIFLSGDAESMWKMVTEKNYGELKNGLFNYKLGYLKNYFQLINDKLKSQTANFAYTNDFDKSKIQVLKSVTLYVPDYMKIKYNGWTRKDTVLENPDELFEKYEYKYEFIDSDELSEKILDATEDFYYLTYVKVNANKFVNVVNGKTGEVIFSLHDSGLGAYHLKDKDFGKLNDAVKKSK